MSRPRKKPQNMRGPSRPIDPRNAPGAPRKKGPDSFGVSLIAVSTVVILGMLLLYALVGRSTVTNTATVPNSTTDPASQNPPTPDATQTFVAFSTETVDLPRISPDEAKALHEAQNATFIDVRPQASYDQEHIAGARNLPFDQLSSRINEIPRSGNVVLYCQ